MTLEKSAVKLRLSFATPKQMRIRRIISFQTQLKTQNHDKKNNKFYSALARKEMTTKILHLITNVSDGASIFLQRLGYTVCFMSVD